MKLWLNLKSEYSVPKTRLRSLGGDLRNGYSFRKEFVFNISSPKLYGRGLERNF